MLLRMTINGLSCQKQDNGHGKEEAQIRKEIVVDITAKRNR
jgi:hypothetical protein